MAQTKIQSMIQSGATPEQIANYIKSDLTPVASKKRTSAQIYESMGEQDISLSDSPLRELQLAYNMGEISDEQYAEIHQMLDL